MAKSPVQPAYDPATEYAVTLARPVRVGAMLVKPISEIVMVGAVLTDIVAKEGADAIVSAVAR